MSFFKLSIYSQKNFWFGQNSALGDLLKSIITSKKLYYFLLIEY